MGGRNDWESSNEALFARGRRQSSGKGELASCKQGTQNLSSFNDRAPFRGGIKQEGGARRIDSSRKEGEKDLSHSNEQEREEKKKKTKRSGTSAIKNRCPRSGTVERKVASREGRTGGRRTSRYGKKVQADKERHGTSQEAGKRTDALKKRECVLPLGGN